MSVRPELAAFGSLSADVLAFPPRPEHCRAFADRLASVVTLDWSEHHLPVISAMVDLLHLDDACFRSRLAAMRDPEGQALILELVDAINDASAGVRLVSEALALVRSRITVGLADGGAR